MVSCNGSFGGCLDRVRSGVVKRQGLSTASNAYPTNSTPQKCTLFTFSICEKTLKKGKWNEICP